MDSLKLKLPAVLKNALKSSRSFLFLIDNKVDGTDKNDREKSFRAETIICSPNSL